MDERIPATPGPRPRRPGFFDRDRTWLNILLLVLTAGSAFFVGLSWSASYVWAGRPGSPPAQALNDPRIVGLSLLYAAVLMAILLAHEMGHFLSCRRYGLNATLPFFIPAPTLIGTMGAFIKIRSQIRSRRQLFDVGIAGPLAGFVLALPATAIGLAASRVVPSLPRENAILFGEPLIIKALGALLLPHQGAGFDIVLHPVAFAGWVGMLITALNLLPMGQLDGGHIIYAVFGDRSRRLAPWILGLFVVLGVVFWFGWFVWGVVILFLGLKHPPVYDTETPLGRGRTILAWAALLIFLLSFIPDPVQGYDLLHWLKIL